MSAAKTVPASEPVPVDWLALVALLGGVLCIGGVIVARSRGQGPMRSSPRK